MSFVISSFIPFPPISWWASIIDKETIYWDGAEHFRKITYRNRYYISGGDGMITMSIPLSEGGRSQRTIMKDVLISPRDQWQIRHWRTLVSAYARSPYFEYYEPGLKNLFESAYEKLADFSLASVHWLKGQLDMGFEERSLADKSVFIGDIVDLRRLSPRSLKMQPDFPQYQQVFLDRLSFIPDLSILDLLFAEGPYTKKWLEDNRKGINIPGEI